MSSVFGIDIMKRHRGKPRFALFIIDGEEDNDEVKIKKFVSKAKLFKLIRVHKPSIIAIDNISELFSSKEECIAFLKGIPHSTKLVQIAGKQSLPYLARRFGLNIDIKDPIDEAKASAYLASFGVGEEVSVFVDKTRITVSRNRSLGKGGWRQNKYSRKVHDGVRRIFREIKSILDEQGIYYEENVRPGYGGLSKGELVVNAPRNEVPINSFKTKDVQVRVESVEKEKIEFIPLSKTTLHTIVGIDPGTTTGVASFDLNGNLLGVRSKKNWSSGEVVDYILSLGQPLIIATDKSNAPDMVSKLKASFNSILYTPKTDISVDKKKNLVSEYKFLNDHERDAAAAALDAFNFHKNKLLNVEKRVPPGMDIDTVKASVLRGLSLKEAITSKITEEPKDIKVVQESIPKEEILRRDKLIKELENENLILKKEISVLRDEIDRLHTKMISYSKEEHEKIRKDTYVKNLGSENLKLRKELKTKEKEIEILGNQLKKLKKMKMLEFLGWKSIKLLKKFTKEEIEKLEKEVKIKEGDIILILEASGAGKSSAEYLVNKGVRAVIITGAMSHLALSVFDDEGIPVIEAEELEVEASDDIAVINFEIFEKVYNKKMDEIEKKKVDKLEELVLEYKKRRLE